MSKHREQTFKDIFNKPNTVFGQLLAKVKKLQVMNLQFAKIFRTEFDKPLLYCELP